MTIRARDDDNDDSSQKEGTLMKSKMWDTILKINLSLLPFVATWAIWVTSFVFEAKNYMEQGSKFTVEAAKIQESEIKDWVRANFPDSSLKADIKDLQLSLKATQSELNAFRLEMARGTNRAGNP